MVKRDCQVFGLMAREAPVCVLFRRGPIKWVQLVTWRTDKDTFRPGDWLRARVAERRSDLSPNGRHLLYFAARFTHNPPKIDPADEGYAPGWTAISRPPSFRAEMLWTKPDAWNGGGLFLSNKEIWLNQRPEEATPHPEFNTTLVKFTPNPKAYGEDDPVYQRRLERDGWQCIRHGKYRETGFGRARWVLEPTEIWEKDAGGGRKLRREFQAINVMRKGGRYVETYDLVLPDGSALRLPEAGWADLDQQGRLVFSRGGKVLRGELAGGRLVEEELIDLADNQPPARTPDTILSKLDT